MSIGIALIRQACCNDQRDRFLVIHFCLERGKELRLSLFLGEFVFFSEREKRKKMGKFFGWAVVVVS